MRYDRTPSDTPERSLTTDREQLKRSPYFPNTLEQSGGVDPDFDEPSDVRLWMRFEDADLFADDWDLIKW